MRTMSALGRDLAFALRALRRTPSYAVAVIAMVTIGVAAGAVLFTVYKGAVLDPWPYEGGDRLLVFRGHYPTQQRSAYPLWSAADFRELRELASVFEHVIAGRGRDATLSGGHGAERVRGAELTPDAFRMLGIAPLAGRTLTPADAEPGAPAVVVIGHALWQRRFGGDPAAIGSSLSIEGAPHVIVGVMPPRFLWWGSELWFPLGLDVSDARRDQRQYVVQARLRAGVDAAQANAALDTWARVVEQAHAARYPEYEGWRASVGLLRDAVLGNVGDVLRMLLVAVGVLVLVAAFNVANLLLARAAERRREFAVRAALGASYVRMIRVLLAENLVLASAGGLLGLLGAALGTGLVVGLIPYGYFPAEANVAFDARVVAIAIGLALAVAVLAVIPAAASLGSLNVAGAVRESRGTGSKGAVRLRSAFVVAEVALAAGVVAAALAVGDSLRTQLAVDPGFVTDRAVSMRVSLPAHLYPDRPALRRFASTLEERLAAMPGIEAAGVGIAPPLAGGALYPVSVRDRPDGRAIESRYEVVAGDWFEALGARLVAGRRFDARDRAGTQPVAIVNETFVRRLLDGADPIGRQVRAGPGADEREWLTVVGVMGDVRVGGLDGEVRPLVYQPMAQSALQLRNPFILVRGAAPPDALVGSVRELVRTIDAAVPVYDVAGFREIVVDSLGGHRLAVWLLGGFGLTVLLLAAMGVYGIVSWVTQLSRGELALRMAFGATGMDILRLVGRRSVVLGAAGMAIGLVLAVFALRYVSFALGQPAGATAPVLLVTSALLAFIVAAACAGPAVAGARTNPAGALREG